MTDDTPTNWKRVWVKVKRAKPRRWKRGWKRVGNLRERALREAQLMVGIMEQGGNNQGAKVMEIIRANGGTGPEAWCGDFVAACYRKAGSKTISRDWAAVRLLGRLRGQKVVVNPLPGDLVCFTFDHVGIFVRFDGDHLITVEGNTGATGAVSDSSTGGDGVYVKRRDKALVARYVRVLA